MALTLLHTVFVVQDAEIRERLNQVIRRYPGGGHGYHFNADEAIPMLVEQYQEYVNSAVAVVEAAEEAGASLTSLSYAPTEAWDSPAMAQFLVILERLESNLEREEDFMPSYESVGGLQTLVDRDTLARNPNFMHTGAAGYVIPNTMEDYYHDMARSRTVNCAGLDLVGMVARLELRCEL